MKGKIMIIAIRKIITVVEELRIEQGKVLPSPLLRAAAIAVVENPFAGRYQEDLSSLIEAGAGVGQLLVEKAIAALGTEGSRVHSYGKAAIAGEEGELEHVAAILHPRFGAPVRDALGGGAALIPSSKKRAGPGASIDIPLGHKDAAYVRSHFDAMEIRVTDAPRAREMVVALALAIGGRPLPRIGGLTVEAIKGEDGLR
jgi:Amino acid synthesis